MDHEFSVFLLCQDPSVCIHVVSSPCKSWLNHIEYMGSLRWFINFLYNSGDRYLRPWIIPDPDVMFIPRTKEDDCLILATDGLWDVMNNDEACDAARRRILLWHKKHGDSLPEERAEGDPDPAAQAAADYLSKLAIHKGSKDNITVIVVDLKAQRRFKRKT